MKRLSMSKKKNKPLRLTPEYFAQRAEQRAAIEIAGFYVETMAEAMKAVEVALRYKYKITEIISIEVKNQKHL